MRIVSGPEAAVMIERLLPRGQQAWRIRDARHADRERRAARAEIERCDAMRSSGTALRAKTIVARLEQEMAEARERFLLLAEILAQVGAEHPAILRMAEARSWTRTSGGNFSGPNRAPLESVGCYVPGGRYPLVSTLLMTVIPAQVAGVKNIRVVSPKPSQEVLGAAAHAGRT